MVCFIWIFLILSNFLFGIKKYIYPLCRIKKNKCFFLIVLSFIALYTLMAGYRNYSGLSGDIANNNYEYLKVQKGFESAYEVGYILLMKLGHLFSLDFFQWRSLMFAVGLVLVFFSICKWSSNPHLVIAFFSVYSVIAYSEHFRNFLGLAVFQVGLSIYFFSNTKCKKIFYTIFTLMAGMIHSIFLIYLLLLLIDKVIDKKTIKIIVGGVLAFCILIFLRGNNIPGIDIVLALFSESRISIYLQQKTRYGFLYPMLLHFTSTFLTYYAYKNGKKERTQELIYKANLIMMVCFPLYMLQISFYRIARNLLIISYFSQAAFVIESNTKKSKKIYLCYCVFTLAIWFYVTLSLMTNSEALLYPFFSDNFFVSD